MYKINRNQQKKSATFPFKRLAIYLIFFIGMLTLLYPFYVSALNDYLDHVRIANYKQKVADQFNRRHNKLKKDNDRLQETDIVIEDDPFYDSNVTNISEADYNDYLLGSISIPKLKITIPLFDRTNHTLLTLGATVLNGTSYPLGGKSTHSVISGHRGLPNRTLFTDLPKLKKGDKFVLTVLGKKLAYQVDNIQVVSPDQSQLLKIEPEKDLVTLLTCTPYMINSHRLLVRGTRIAYTKEIRQALENSGHYQSVKRYLLLAGFILLCLGIVGMLYRVIHNYLLAKQQMTIALQILDLAEHPIKKSVLLYDKKGKKKLIRQGKVVQLVSDHSGTYQITGLPKGLYCVKTDDGTVSLLVGQPKLRKSTIILKATKASDCLSKFKINLVVSSFLS